MTDANRAADLPGAAEEPAPTWAAGLNANPLPWLLEPENASVRHQTLVHLFDRPDDDPEVEQASALAMTSDPIAAILAAQLPDGNWVKDGPGYSPKYTATVWQVIFLDQLGADPKHPQVRAACEFVLDHTRAETGGFGASAVITELRPAPSRVIHCLNGNLMRALLGFGYLDDPRLQTAIDWEARSILGVEGFKHYDGHGPGFACGANEGLPCAWGAVKGLLGLARVPREARTSLVSAAIDRGVEFLLSRDPRVADYPMGWGNTKASSSWFKLGFPSGYVADVLQNLEVLCELGQAADPRLDNGFAWLLSKQDAQGRWRNEYAYNRKTWVDFEKQGETSKWVTLRACRVFKMVHEARAPAHAPGSPTA